MCLPVEVGMETNPSLPVDWDPFRSTPVVTCRTLDFPFFIYNMGFIKNVIKSQPFMFSTIRWSFRFPSSYTSKFGPGSVSLNAWLTVILFRRLFSKS